MSADTKEEHTPIFGDAKEALNCAAYSTTILATTNMKTPTLPSFLLIILCGTLHAQLATTSDRASERYQQRLAAAEKIKTDGVAKLTASYDAEVKSARDEVKRAFDPLIKAAAMRNQTEEVRTLTLKMESIINPDGVVLSPDSSAEPAGNDFKQLLGKWEVSDVTQGYERSFEFKSPKIVLYTYNYTTSGSGKGSNTEELKATIKPDKIVIERKESRGVRYADSSYKQWYEIKLPFDINSLEITDYTERSGGSSNSTFRLRRKK